MAVSTRQVSPGFIALFQAMLAMNMNKVSMGYGSSAPALPIAMCIIPCRPSGASQEKALSMRSGSPAASTSRSSGPCGKLRMLPASGVLGLAPLPAGPGAGGIGRGKGDL